MSKIYEAKLLKEQIEKHSHYGPCLRGNNWENFKSLRNKLNSISSTYNSIITERQNLISCKNNLTRKEQEYNRFKDYKYQEYKNKEFEYKNEIEIMYKNNQNCLKSLEADIRYEESRENNELNSINQDINYLNNEIYQSNINYQREIENQKILKGN